MDANQQQILNAMRAAGILQTGEGQGLLMHLLAIADVSMDILAIAISQAPANPKARRWLDDRLTTARSAMVAATTDDPFGCCDPSGIDEFMGANRSTREPPRAQGPNRNEGGGNEGTGRHEAEAGFDPRKASVYGRKAMIVFVADDTVRGEPTVNLYALAAIGPRRYDKTSKLQLQLTRSELPIVTAVFAGQAPSCKFSAHGPAHDKGFSFERKGDVVMASAWAKGRSHTVPVVAADAFYICAILWGQLARHAPGLDGAGLALTLKAAAAIYHAPELRAPLREAQGGR